MSRLHGDNWTEWEVVVNALPKWDGHLQPNLPVEQLPAFGRGVSASQGSDVLSQLLLRHSHSNQELSLGWPPSFPFNLAPSFYRRRLPSLTFVVLMDSFYSFFLNKIQAQENTPEGMGGKISAAQDAGIDVFMFDWYWYAEQGSDGGGGGFLNGALDDGFLNVPNNVCF